MQSYRSQGQEASFRNGVTEVYVSENALVTVDKLQYDGDIRSIITEQAHQEGNSQFRINTITLDGGWVRNNLNIALDGDNCDAHLYGLYLLKGKQHVDNHTMVDHRYPNGVSNELYKGLMDEKSTAVFNGKVFVRQDAQKTNAYQTNANILMTDTATINSKPELEIYADDVKCSHGSTTGQFDEEAVFYLRSRGLSESSARQLLVAGFAADVLEGIRSDAVIEKIHSLLTERFGWEFE